MLVDSSLTNFKTKRLAQSENIRVLVRKFEFPALPYFGILYTFKNRLVKVTSEILRNCKNMSCSITFGLFYRLTIPDKHTDIHTYIHSLLLALYNSKDSRGQI